MKYESIIVSCFYLVKPKPGRSHEKYKEWFNNMLVSLISPIVIFTDENSRKYLGEVNNHLVTFEILDLTNLHFFKYGIDFWRSQQLKDPNIYRSWQVSLLYNEKCFFVDKVMNKYNAEWYIWCDIGCFRDIKSFHFPRVDHLPHHKITLLEIEPFETYEYVDDYLFHTEKQIRIGGGVQVAKKRIWLDWINKYSNMFEHYIKHSTVNCDQSILASLYMKYSEMVNIVPAQQTELTNDKWFYLLEHCGHTELVTIFIPLYNGIEFLEECLNSVINQTFKKWKAIIGINGHSINSDVVYKSMQIVNKINDSRLMIKVYETIGKENTMNNMVLDCNTNWIAVLDVDDKWHPKKLEVQVKYIHKYDVIGTSCQYFGNINNKSPYLPFGEINSNNFDIYKFNPLINSSVLIHKKHAKWYSRYNGLDDYDLWIRLWKKNIPFFNINHILTYHRIHNNSAFNSKCIQDVKGLIEYHKINN